MGTDSRACQQQQLSPPAGWLAAASPQQLWRPAQPLQRAGAEGAANATPASAPHSEKKYGNGLLGSKFSSTAKQRTTAEAEEAAAAAAAVPGVVAGNEPAAEAALPEEQADMPALVAAAGATTLASAAPAAAAEPAPAATETAANLISADWVPGRATWSSY